MSTLKNSVTETYHKFCDYMQNDTKGVEFGIYVASGILFGVAYYKIRPITKFGSPSDIPKHFIRDRIRQRGLIESIEPSPSLGPLLLVNHKPPLNFLIPSRKLLPIKLSGVNINANGYSWLQTVAVGNKIEFIPMNRSKDYAECQVFLICPQYKKDHVDLSEAILGLGFGKIVDPPKDMKDINLKKYYKTLSKVESHAKDERLGLWSYSLPPRSWPIKKGKETFKSIILSLLPAQHRLPELVR